MTFKVLKCSETPVTVTVNNLYFSNAQGDSDSTTLVSNITVNQMCIRDRLYPDGRGRRNGGLQPGI